MTIINKLFKFIINSHYRFNALDKRKFFYFLSDKKYLQLKFKHTFFYDLNLKNPQTFNEKLQWLKLYNRNPLYTTLIDKYAVKKYVADKIGDQYIIPTLGVYNTFDEINFDNLPNQFVLKATHDSGGIIICRDKTKFDKKSAKKLLTKALQNNFYYMYREWPYKNVPRRIIAEQYMQDKGQRELKDYKFFCFNGQPKFLYISHGLENHSTAKISFLNMDWTFAPFYRKDYKQFEKEPKKPKNIEQMINFAKTLSKDIPFVRTDFYEIDQHVYFGELTFYPNAGFIPFYPEIWDKKIGELLILPKKK